MDGGRVQQCEPEFGWEVRDGVGFVTLIGAERKNPLTFASYAALRDHFRALAVRRRRARRGDRRRGGQLLLAAATCATSSAR